jgi:hypothetical protein
VTSVPDNWSTADPAKIREDIELWSNAYRAKIGMPQTPITVVAPSGHYLDMLDVIGRDHPFLHVTPHDDDEEGWRQYTTENAN